MSQVFFVLLLSFVCCSAKVILISPNNPPNKALSNYEYAVISFQDRSIASEGANSVFLHAEDSFSKQYPRRSVGWAILDVVAYPDLVPYQNDKVEYPIQIIGAHKQVLDLDYTVKEGQDLYAAAEAYAQKVAEMTKETFLPISCGDLEEVVKNNKFGKKIFVYFGASDSLNKKMSHLHEVAIFDRFNFHQDSPATFYTNSDKVCKISQGFQKPGPAIGLYLHSDVPMISFFDERDDMNSPTSIQKWMNSAIVSFNQHYGKRAFAAINTMGVSALVYFRKDIETQEEDPMIQKMQGFAQFLRDRNINFLTIVAEPKDNIFKEQSEMEGLWILHGPSGRTEPYPFELDARLISVQMLMMWARQTILEIEIPVIEDYIEKMSKLEESDRDKDHETVLDYYQQQLSTSKEELQIVSSKFIEDKTKMIRQLQSSQVKQKHLQQADEQIVEL